MPLLGVLLQGLIGNVAALYVAIKGAEQAARFVAIGVLAAAYVACALAYTLFIDPLIGALFSTLYGQFIGLAFPPISGSVIAGLAGLWGCIVAKRYYEKFMAMALPK